MSTKHKQVLIIEHPVQARARQLALACYRHLDKRCAKGEMIAHRPCVQFILDPLYQAAQSLYGINKTRHTYISEDASWEYNAQPEFYGELPIDVYDKIKASVPHLFLGRVASRRVKLNKEYNTFIYYDINEDLADNLVSMCIELGVDNVSLISFGPSRIISKLKLMTQTSGMKAIELLDTEEYGLMNALIRGTMMKFYGIEDFE